MGKAATQSRMAWDFRAYIVLAEDLSMAPSAYVGQLTTTCNSRSREADTILLQEHLHFNAHTHIPHPHTNIHGYTQRFKNKVFEKLSRYECFTCMYVWNSCVCQMHVKTRREH